MKTLSPMGRGVFQVLSFGVVEVDAEGGGPPARRPETSAREEEF